MQDLRHLEVFNVFTPHHGVFGYRFRTPPESYRNITQGLADEIFAAVHSSHPLKILAFGKRWQFNSSLEVHEFPFPDRVCFMRAEVDKMEESVVVPDCEAPLHLSGL